MSMDIYTLTIIVSIVIFVFKGLYLFGSGAHPGGGVTGAPGRNAAKRILKDL